MSKLIIVVVITVVVILSIIGGIMYTRASHHQYCENWLTHINIEKQNIVNQIFADQLNSEILDYNKECAY